MDIDVFISYSSKDKAIADAVCHCLEEQNVTCWIAPRDVIPGETYASQIVRAIKDCSLAVLIFSSNSNNSEHVGNEIDKAFNEKKPIIPFVVEDTAINADLDYYLSRKHWLVAYPDYREKTSSLVDTVLHILGKKRISETGQGVPAPSHKRKIFRILAFILAVILLAAGAVFLAKLVKGKRAAAEKAMAIEQILSEMVWVPGGDFVMGADTLGSDGLRDADASIKSYPPHEESVSDFFIGKYEISTMQWNAIMDDSKDGAPDEPVRDISWQEASMFARKLYSITGRHFALPSEAQWEYAAREGRFTRNLHFSGSDTPEDVSWGASNSGGRCHKRGEGIQGNNLDLFDMSGNVSEWCEDAFARYGEQPGEGEQRRTIRGGNYGSAPRELRVDYRDFMKAAESSPFVGVRLVINE